MIPVMAPILSLRDVSRDFVTRHDVSGILVLMVCVMLFNGVLNRLERYGLRWRPRERAASARLQ